MADGSLLKLFNSHLLEFLDDVISIFPNNLDLKTGKTFIEGIKKVNPKKLIEIWKYNIVDIYDDEIQSGDHNFFLNKDYKNDLPADHDTKLVKTIEDVKYLLKNTSIKNRNKAIKYVQNLTKMSKMYFNKF